MRTAGKKCAPCVRTVPRMGRYCLLHLNVALCIMLSLVTSVCHVNNNLKRNLTVTSEV